MFHATDMYQDTVTGVLLAGVGVSEILYTPGHSFQHAMVADCCLVACDGTTRLAKELPRGRPEDRGIHDRGRI